MAENRYAEAHNLINLLLRFADDAGDSSDFVKPAVLADAEARIRELIREEQLLLRAEWFEENSGDEAWAKMQKLLPKSILPFFSPGEGGQGVKHE